MSVQEFLAFFRDDLSKVLSPSTYDEYQKWQPIFFEKTQAFHNLAKRSYFEQINKIIDDSNYFNYYGDLSKFSYLGLFRNNDEIEFSNLIEKIVRKLNVIENTTEMEDTLSFTYSFSDFLLHEYYPEHELKKSLKKLKDKIIEVRELDKKKTGELIIRFIDLMI